MSGHGMLLLMDEENDKDTACKAEREELSNGRTGCLGHITENGA